MRISVLKENLAQITQLAAKFASNKSQLPILSFISLEASGNGIWVRGSTLDTSIKLRLPGKIIKEGGVAVPAKVMSELAVTLPLGGVEIEVDEKHAVTVRGKSHKAVIAGIGLDEFPLFTESPTEGVDLDLIKLEKAWNRLSFAISTDDTRMILTSWLWKTAEGVMVATDGYRLSLVSGEDWMKSGALDENLLIPGRATATALAVFKDLELVKIRLGVIKQSKQLVFDGGNAVVVVRQVEGDYPKYESIIPQAKGVEIVLDRELFLSAVKSVAVFARDSANIIKLCFSDNKVVVSANAAKIGEEVVEVEAETEKEVGGEIAFNYKYLIDLLTHIQAGKICLSFFDGLKPGKWREIDNEGFSHIIMPVRVRG